VKRLVTDRAGQSPPRPSRRGRRLRRRLDKAGEGGFTLVEMLTVLVILGIVMGGLTTMLEQGSSAELDMNNRFQAQSNTRLALDKLRRDLHCASSVSYGSTPSATSVTLDDACISGGAVTWCTSAQGTGYSLYRNAGTTCSTAATARWVDKLTSGNVFWYDRGWQSSLPKLHVDLKANTTSRPSAHTVDTYELCDTIVLRNGWRSYSVSATNGSTSVTGFNSTADLAAGQAVQLVDSSGTTQSTTIGSVTSSTAVTLAASATVGGYVTFKVTALSTTPSSPSPPC
jgi:prepilin-type N-terminal cleavage/methylation domain-containing protein